MNNLHLAFLICIVLYYSKNEILIFLNTEGYVGSGGGGGYKSEKEKEREEKKRRQERKQVRRENERRALDSIDDDVKNNPLKSDYTHLIKSKRQIGFTKKGDYPSFAKNERAGNKIVKGLMSKQSKVVKGGRPIGTKLVYDTGFTCEDSNGDKHPQHIYLNNMGDNNLGLIGEIGNSIANVTATAGKGLKAAFSGKLDPNCREVTLKTRNSIGDEGTKTVYIQNSDLYDISKDDIVEGYDNINNLLADDKLFYKNYFIFTYLFGLSFIFLFLIFKLIIDSN